MPRTIISRAPNWSGLGPMAQASPAGDPGEAATPWRAALGLRTPAQIPVGAAQPLGPNGRNFPNFGALRNQQAQGPAPAAATAIGPNGLSAQGPTPTGAPAPAGVQTSVPRPSQEAMAARLASPMSATTNAAPAATGASPIMPVSSQTPANSSAPVAPSNTAAPAQTGGLINQVGGRNR